MTEKKATSGWTKEPNELIELPEISNTLFRIYCVILAQKKGIRLSLKKLARTLGVSKSTIIRSIQTLIDVGLIEKTKEIGYANKYIPVACFSVDNVREKLIHSRPIHETSQDDTCLTNDTTMCHPCDNLVSPMTQGVSHLERDHTRAYSNCIKTNYKTRSKTKSKTILLSKTEKKYTFENWQKEVAEAWAAFCRQVRPGLDNIINIDQWANEIRLISGQYNLTHMAWTEILNYVRNDSFWSVNAASVMGLRNRGKSGEHKIVQIISRLPKYKTAAMFKAAEANYDPTRNIFDRSWADKKE